MESGALIAAWMGRLGGVSVFLAGTATLWPPPPPTTTTTLAALPIYLGAMVILTIGEFIAFYVEVLDHLPKNPDGVADAKKIQNQAIELATKALRLMARQKPPK
jgi:hypothetical protein